MKPKDIVIGRKYTHKVHGDTVYLGCGYEKNGKAKKFLIVIAYTDKDSVPIGTAVQPYDPSNWSSLNFWEGFIPLEEKIDKKQLADMVVNMLMKS